MKIKIKTDSVDRMLDKLLLMPEEVMESAYVFFRNKTPIREGNARNKTKLERKLTIGAKYPYAGRLDEGWSKQAPKGMTEPTLKEIDKLVGNYVKRIS